MSLDRQDEALGESIARAREEEVGRVKAEEQLVEARAIIARELAVLRSEIEEMTAHDGLRAFQRETLTQVQALLNEGRSEAALAVLTVFGVARRAAAAA